MSSLQHLITSYLHDVQNRSNLQDYQFTSNQKFADVPLGMIRSGKLPDEIIARFAPKAPEEKKTKPIDVVISLVTLQADGKKTDCSFSLPHLMSTGCCRQTSAPRNRGFLPADSVPRGLRSPA